MVGFIVEPAVVDVGGVAWLTAVASDPEGEALAFAWTSTAGELANDADPGVEWIAPNDPGAYRIDVRVTDSRGLFDERSAFVAVVDPNDPVPGDTPPTILSLTASPVAVSVGETSEVTVEAIDPDGDLLDYEWLMGVGTGDGTGPQTDWTPVYDGWSCCDTKLYPVGVIVRDGRGGEDSAYVGIFVSAD